MGTDWKNTGSSIPGTDLQCQHSESEAPKHGGGPGHDDRELEFVAKKQSNNTGSVLP